MQLPIPYRAYWFVLLFLFNTQLTIAQASVSPEVYRQSFRLKDNIILVEAQVFDQTGFFILDTGSPILVLHRNWFSGGRNASKLYALNGQVVSQARRPVDLVLGPWVLKNEWAQLVDLTHLEQRLGLPILGLLGSNVLAQYELEIDFQTTEITFYTLDRRGQRLTPRSGRQPRWCVPLVRKAHLLVAEVQIGEKGCQMALDTGAGVSLLDQRHRNMIGLENPLLQGGLHTFTRSIFDHTSTLTRAKVQYHDFCSAPLPIVLTDLSVLTQQSVWCNLDGFLGGTFFSQQRISINYQLAQLCLWTPLSSGQVVWPQTEQQ